MREAVHGDGQGEGKNVDLQILPAIHLARGPDAFQHFKHQDEREERRGLNVFRHIRLRERDSSELRGKNQEAGKVAAGSLACRGGWQLATRKEPGFGDLQIAGRYGGRLSLFRRAGCQALRQARRLPLLR
ncbi:MAG: hypothetical protein DME18_06305 [Verrucomicrobia bacterium]|nr:MAG: hypothetical protein DME18_06305 [Verrucomicrobiota bacterium]